MISEIKSGSQGKPLGFRWTICALLFTATTINYMDRQVLGILAPTLDKELGWTEIQYSNIVTAFQAAYAIGLVAFGRIIDLLGTKRGYQISIASWSLAAMAHALATGVYGFGMARFALGLGEAGNFPAAVKAVGEWFPTRERALATGLFNSGANVGAILAPVLVPWITVHWGWQMSFVILGATGFVWMIFWRRYYSTPEESTHISPEELAYINNDKVKEELTSIPWKLLLGYRQTWAVIVGMSMTAPIWWFYLYWLPKFMHKQYGLDLASLGAPLVIIYTMSSVGSVGGGWLSGFLMKRGMSTNWSRKLTMLICAISVIPVVFTVYASNLWVATALIGLATSAHQGWSANLFTLVSDLFPKQAVASVVGLSAMFGSIAAMIFSQAVGHILEATGSYWSLFVISASAYIIAIFIIQLLIPKMTPVVLMSKN